MFLITILGYILLTILGLLGLLRFIVEAAAVEIIGIFVIALLFGFIATSIRSSRINRYFEKHGYYEEDKSFIDEFKKHYGRMPDDEEYEAYLDWKFEQEYDGSLGDLDAYDDW